MARRVQSFFDFVLAKDALDTELLSQPSVALFLFQRYSTLAGNGGIRAESFSAATQRLFNLKTPGEVIARALSTGEAHLKDAPKPQPNEPRGVSLFYQSLKKALMYETSDCYGVHLWQHIYGPGNVPLVLELRPEWIAASTNFSRQRLAAIIGFVLRGGSGNPPAFGFAAKDTLMRRLLSHREIVVAAPPIPPHTANIAPQGQAQQEQRKVIGGEALSFCMASDWMQWWALLHSVICYCSAEEKASDSQFTEKLSVELCLLFAGCLTPAAIFSPTRHALPFPDKPLPDAPASRKVTYQFLIRLADVGLIYPISSGSDRCFAVSPFFAVAVNSLQNVPFTRAVAATKEMMTAATSTPISPSTVVAPSKSGSAGVPIPFGEEGTVITETNFRLYAYVAATDLKEASPLLSILDQFAVRDASVCGGVAPSRKRSDGAGSSPLFVVYILSRDAFIGAVERGISAAQVISFLHERAHPAMLTRNKESDHHGGSLEEQGKGSVVVPQSICDQLKMWESECHRVRYAEETVLLSFPSSDMCEVVASVVEGDVLWRGEFQCVVSRVAFDRKLAPLIRGAGALGPLR